VLGLSEEKNVNTSHFLSIFATEAKEQLHIPFAPLCRPTLIPFSKPKFVLASFLLFFFFSLFVE
jgi:hypothetical protein